MRAGIGGVAAAILTMTALAAGAFGDEVYFIAQGTGTGPKPQTAVAIDRSGNRIDDGRAKSPPPLAGDAGVRVDADGHGVKMLAKTQNQDRMRAVSASADGKQLIFNIVSQATNAAAMSSHLLITPADASSGRTVDLSKLGVRVFGTPVLLPDGKHVGLTVCSLAAKSAAPAVKGGPRGTGAKPDPIAARGAAQLAWTGGQFPSQPFVAVVDLDGHNLKQLAPGAMPCWSPDGKTILYTAMTVDNPQTEPVSWRLSEMDASGGNSRTVAPETTCDGWFSPDGSRIVYVGDITHGPQATSELFVADADGSNIRPIQAEKALYACPRWIGGGAGTAIEAVVSGSVWILGVDGAPRRRLSPDVAELKYTFIGCAIDVDVSAWITRVSHAKAVRPQNVAGPPGGGAPADEVPPNGVGAATGGDVNRTKLKQVPKGYTVEYRGTSVFLRDARGNRTPMPDGDYQVSGGQTLHVRDGKNVIISN